MFYSITIILVQNNLRQLCHIIILNENLDLNAPYSAILHRKPMKFGIQEDQLMLLLVTTFSWLPV